MTLLPPAPDVCQECATGHPHELPHNLQSLYYELAFHAKHGRRPTWTDAMAHCAEPVRRAWRQRLIEVLHDLGRPIPDDLVGETKGGGR